MQNRTNSPYYTSIQNTLKYITLTVKFNSRWVLLLLICFTLSNSGYGQQQHDGHPTKNSVFISGELKEGLDTYDTIYIEVFDDFMAESNATLPYRFFEVPVKDGKYNLTIDSIYKLTYFNISPSTIRGRVSTANINSLRNLILLPGDSLTFVNNIMKSRAYGYYVSGRGAITSNCLSQMDQMTDIMTKVFQLNFITNRTQRPLISIVEEIDTYFSHYDELYNKQLEILHRFRPQLNAHVFDVISINLIAENLHSKLNRLNLSVEIFEYNNITKSDYFPVLSEYENNLAANIDQLFHSFPDNALIDSYALPKCIHEYTQVKNKISSQTFDIFGYTDHIINQKIRDRVLFLYFLNRHELMRIDNIKVQANALERIGTPLYRDILGKVYDSIQIGSTAYNFELPDAHNNRIQLSDFLGKVVFIDFWYTGCGACIQYHRDVLKSTKEHFKNTPDIVFITISIDTDSNDWKKAVASGYYTSDDAINLYTDGLGGTHPVIQHYGIKAYPRPILIDQKGRIYNTDKNDLRLSGAQKLISVIEECLKRV